MRDASCCVLRCATPASAFKAFSQADGSTTRQYGGTGLGLAISRQLVELMGGRIGVESPAGGGSTFWFELALPTAQAVAPAPRAGLAGRRVLIVEDNDTNRTILEHQAEAFGLRRASAPDGEQALALLRDAAAHGQPFELALIDMKMPGLSGIELARQVQADPALAGLRMVLLTSVTATNELAEARAAGLDTILSKPVRQADLLGAIADALGADAVSLNPHPAPAPESHRSLAGRRVLLVEDTPVNQQVATAMLEGMGCVVLLAHDGQQAVHLAAARDVDAVLMDCQMPVLDGFEATRRIRLAEAGGPRVPIIALTANALHGDRERCLAAGMDDYLSKPFSGAALRAALGRWLAPASAMPEVPPAAEPGAADPDRVESDSAIFDPRALDEIRTLDHDGSLLPRLLQLFSTDGAALLDRLALAQAAQDLDAQVMAAHTLASSSANVGALRLSVLARAVEHAARLSHTLCSPTTLAELRAAFEAARAAIAANPMTAPAHAPEALR